MISKRNEDCIIINFFLFLSYCRWCWHFCHLCYNATERILSELRQLHPPRMYIWARGRQSPVNIINH